MSEQKPWPRYAKIAGDTFTETIFGPDLICRNPDLIVVFVETQLFHLEKGPVLGKLEKRCSQLHWSKRRVEDSPARPRRGGARFAQKQVNMN